jgi:hypothetical protein
MWTLLFAVPDAFQLTHRQHRLAYVVNADGQVAVEPSDVDVRVELTLMTATMTVYNLHQMPPAADCMRKCDNGAD